MLKIALPALRVVAEFLARFLDGSSAPMLVLLQQARAVDSQGRAARAGRGPADGVHHRFRGKENHLAQHVETGFSKTGQNSGKGRTSNPPRT